MAIDADELKRLNADYTAATGKPVKKFVCPITLVDDPAAALCDGHILNKSIAKARRATIIQRKDVDNHFGDTIESELVRFLNTPVSTPKELLLNARPLTVTLPTGEKVEGFFADKKARAKFQQMDLLHPETGEVVASPFLRSGNLGPKLHRGLQTEWLIKFTNSALLGSLLKSAHLTMFRLTGYRWIFDLAGDKVRSALAAFYNEKADKEGSVRYFSEFTGAFNVLLNATSDGIQDTLNDRLLWLHYAGGGPGVGFMFAQTCLFCVNNRLVTITLPADPGEGRFQSALQHYASCLKDRNYPQAIHPAIYHPDWIEVGKQPLGIKYAPLDANREARAGG